ncbi:MAG: TonB-dependent receptor plug domain-containing protein, partial [Gemmatimonadales bacterium]
EPDVYRALALVPAVSFTSPLSARPLLRGYDAGEVTTRIDGFEVQNLYHLGRLFSSFPADATEALTVTAAPATSALGGSIAGLIDLTGRSGRDDGFHAGGSWSYGSLSAYAGGGSERVRYFGTARVFYWKSLELVPKLDVPYHFADLYAGAVIGPADRPRARVTAFATQDRAGKRTEGDFLDWNNVLIGARARVLDAGATSVELTGSVNRVVQLGENVPGLTQGDFADLRNAFGRAALGAEVVHVASRSRFVAGVQLGSRSIENSIGVSDDQFRFGVASPFPTTDLETVRTEFAGYASVSRRVGALTVEAAGRIDAAGAVHRVQPRLHARWQTGRVELSAGWGRTSRLHHFVAEARSEPDFDYLDFWLPAGDSVPVASADHLTLDANVDLAPFVLRVSAYRSRASGVGEIRPAWDQRLGGFDYFRFGDGRTRGLEAQLAFRGGPGSPHSLSVSYVLSRSERRWSGEWVPWTLDRTHQFRGFGQWRRGRLTMFGALDVASGWNVTPVTYYQVPTDPPGGQRTGLFVPPVYGPENSAATAGTFRLDGGIALTFGGPRRNRFTFGVSVINLLATAAAPIVADGSGSRIRDDAGRLTAFARIVNLPPIPTLTLRLDF